MLRVKTRSGNVYTLAPFGEYGVYSWQDECDGLKGVGFQAPEVGRMMLLLVENSDGSWGSENSWRKTSVVEEISAWRGVK